VFCATISQLYTREKEKKRRSVAEERQENQVQPKKRVRDKNYLIVKKEKKEKCKRTQRRKQEK